MLRIFQIRARNSRRRSKRLGQPRRYRRDIGGHGLQGGVGLREIRRGEQLLRLAEAPDLTGDEEFTIAFRMEPHLKSNPAGDIYWHLKIGDLEIKAGFAPGQIKAFVSASTPSLSCNTGNVIPADVFSFITVYFDTAELYIDVNDSNKASAVGSGTGIVTPATGIEAGVSAAIEMNISIDELGLWIGATALNAAQRTTLYSGNYGQRPTVS